jgi:hypothetical protein
MSESLSARSLPPDIVYLVESMRPIDKKYNDKTIEAAENVQNHLEREFNLHFRRAYKTQGSVRTATNIKLYSDIDLLTVIDSYMYLQGPVRDPYTKSNPDDDIKLLRSEATRILKDIYDIVDVSNDKCISIFNKSLKRKVDIVFGFWYNSEKYEEDYNEHYRGIHLYNFPHGPKKQPADFPFAHINNVNYKGEQTNDGSRRAVRLLKTLRADSDLELKVLKSFELTTIAHSIEDEKLYYRTGRELSIAIALSEKMKLLIENSSMRMATKSPNGTEFPLIKDGIVPEMKSLKADLDILIEDASRDIMHSTAIEKAILTY